jgi:hypothetical protein
MVSVSALLAYPEPSNCHLKPKNRSEVFLLVSGAKMLLTNRFCVFNDDCSAQNRPRELKLEIKLHHLEVRILNMSSKLF